MIYLGFCGHFPVFLNFILPLFCSGKCVGAVGHMDAAAGDVCDV